MYVWRCDYVIDRRRRERNALSVSPARACAGGGRPYMYTHTPSNNAAQPQAQATQKQTREKRPGQASHGFLFWVGLFIGGSCTGYRTRNGNWNILREGMVVVEVMDGEIVTMTYWRFGTHQYTISRDDRRGIADRRRKEKKRN